MTDLTAPANLSSPRFWFYGPSGLRAGWRLLIFFGILTALLKGENWMIRRYLHGLDDVSNFLVFELSSFLTFLFVSWGMARIEGRKVADYGLPWRKMFRNQFWVGAAFGFAALTLLLTVLRLSGVFYFGTIALRGGEILQWAFLFALVFILVALKEEFALRGYALFTLSTGIGFWPAAIVSSAYFGYGHLGNSGENWFGAVQASAFGMLACLLLRRTGNLWLPIGFHTAWDWGQTYFYGVPDSGIVVPGHLLNSKFVGPAWLTGGTVGPEGSVLCLVLIIALWFLFAAIFREAKYPDPAAIPDPRRPQMRPTAAASRQHTTT
ncbi:MAG TPA: CPBP family intramembrane glutamic endopeptidase [Candidatus Limnocylindria bacterium]|nr:CPBP family intramembrane glutamic endopeptidase [Candidatus Limnocylindria bacterium]